MAESNAILKYLADTQPSIPEHLFPKDPKKRAIVDQFLEWYQYHFRTSIIPELHSKLGKLKAGLEYPDDLKQKHDHLREWALETLEKLVQQHPGDFICGEEVTIADLQLFFEATDLYLLKRNLDSYPNVKKWYDRVAEVKEVKAIQDVWQPAIDGFVEPLNA